MGAEYKSSLDREDWISRFFGFLGAYRYKRSKYGETRGLERRDNTWLAQRDVGAQRPLSDNIVYVYGIPHCGKNEYRKFLSDELDKKDKYSEGYVCVELDMAQLQKKSAYLPEAMKMAMNDAGISTYFYDLGQLDTAADDWLTRFNKLAKLIQELNDQADNIPKRVTLISECLLGLRKKIDNHGVANEESRRRLSEEVQSKLMEFFGRTKAGEAGKEHSFYSYDSDERDGLRAGGNEPLYGNNINADAPLLRTVIRQETDFDFLFEDLQYETYGHNKRIIFFVRHYEEAYPSLKPDEYDRFVKLMRDSENVVWVLMSRCCPQKAELAYIRKENCWRFGECDSIRKVAAYIESSLPEIYDREYAEDWIRYVYMETAGYVCLLDICIRAEQSPEKNFGEWFRRRYRREVSTIQKSQFDAWLRRVWNDGPWELCDELTGFGPLEFLFGRDYNSFLNNSADRCFALPALCFLAYLSENGAGTIEQFKWRRQSEITFSKETERGLVKYRVNRYGIPFIRSIETGTPFCREYEEYPDIYYLDPVLIRIIRKHDKYTQLCESFIVNCTEPCESSAGKDANVNSFDIRDAISLQEDQVSAKINITDIETIEVYPAAEAHTVKETGKDDYVSHPEPGSEQKKEELPDESIRASSDMISSSEAKETNLELQKDAQNAQAKVLPQEPPSSGTPVGKEERAQEMGASNVVDFSAFRAGNTKKGAK